ncbi:MAG: hypothetical protein P4L36_04755 [Holophaga sp.]|nr:hypothetical protein [Holophaga sp.]
MGRIRARRLPWATGLALACLLQGHAGRLQAQDPAGVAANVLPASVVAAMPVTLGAEARQKLMAMGNCSSYFQAQPGVDLCPNPVAAADIRRTLAATQPNIGIQTLAAEAMPPRLASRPDRTLLLYNALHQFRSMEGIHYYSASQGRMRAFCTTSHVVRGPGDRTALEDPHYPVIEAHDLYVEQDDSTFGRTLYSVTVKGLPGGAVELTMTNVEQVRYGFLPVLGPGALKLTLVVQPSADGGWLYFYGNAGVRAIRLPGMESRVRTSFSNRIMALYLWFANQAARA